MNARPTRGKNASRNRSPRHNPASTTQRDAELLAEAQHLRLKKRFAQHFLVNREALERITELALPNNATTATPTPAKHVIEIGPGAGFLTECLMKRTNHVTGVDVERGVCEYLRQKFADNHRFTLKQADITKTDLTELTETAIPVVGNLPYNITAPIVFHLLGELDQPDWPNRTRIQSLTIMVQDEVARRLAAKPGDKAYNSLSIAVQFYNTVEYGFCVGPKSFAPPPKVNSGVVKITPKTEPLCHVDNLTLFKKLVHGVFTYRRKTIQNGLLQAGFGPKTLVEQALSQAEIDAGARPQTVPIEQFARLCNALGNAASQT